MPYNLLCLVWTGNARILEGRQSSPTEELYFFLASLLVSLSREFVACFLILLGINCCLLGSFRIAPQ